jgi:hypothetical protein
MMKKLRLALKLALFVLFICWWFYVPPGAPILVFVGVMQILAGTVMATIFAFPVALLPWSLYWIMFRRKQPNSTDGRVYFTFVAGLVLLFIAFASQQEWLLIADHWPRN